MSLSDEQEQMILRLQGRVEDLELNTHSKFSDDDHGQYLLIDGSRKMTGPLELRGWARVWKSLDLTPSTTHHPTSNPPGTTDYQDVPFDAYSDATEEQVFFIWHIPHDFAEGTTNVKGHFGGMVAVDPDGQTEYIAMGFEFTRLVNDTVFDISTPDGGGSVNITLGDGEGNYLFAVYKCEIEE